MPSASGLSSDEVRDLFGETGATLSTKSRKNLPDSAFAIPEKRAYPIHDEGHARNALARVAQHGSPDEKKRVKAAVKRRYPQIKTEPNSVMAGG